MKIKNTALLLLCLFILGIMPTSASAEVDNPFEAIATTSYDSSDMPDKFQKKSGFVAMNKRDHNSYICFKGVNFSAAPYAVVVGTATSSDYMTNNTYEIRIDAPKGELISTVYVTECADWGNPVENIGTITKTITGVHDVYISTNQPNDFYNFYFMAKIKGEFPYVPYSTYQPFYDTADNKHEFEINSLFGLGIVDGTSESEFTPLLPVTRKEYAKWFVRLMTDEVPEAGNQIFSDMEADSDGFSETAFLYENGIATLNSEKTYMPWSFITIRDAAVMALRLLGYDKLCQHKGGYPRGYDVMARDLGLYGKNIPTDYLRRDTAAELLYNTIRASNIEITGISDGEPMYTEKTAGILYQTRKIRRGEDVVTAGSYGGLMGDMTMPDGTCYIGTTRYELGDINLESLLGVKCEFFYRESDNGETKTLLSIQPAKKTVQKLFETNKGVKITNLTSADLTYEDENERRKSIKIPLSAMWIYNNRTMAVSQLSTVIPDISKFKGIIRLVDNGDGYETVVIENYKTVQLQSMDFDNNAFYDGLEGKAYSFKDKKLLLSDGSQAVSPKKVKKGQVAELYVSADNEMAVLLFGETSIKGIAEEHIVSENKLRIGNVYYYTANEFDKDELILGATAEFVLNRHNEIVYVNNDNVKSIALLCNTTQENHKIYVELLTASGKKENFEAVKKFWLDGKKMDDYTDVLTALAGVNQYSVVLYNINEDGMLTLLDTPTNDVTKIGDKNTLRELLAYDSTTEYFYRTSSRIFTPDNKFSTAISYPAKNDSTVIAVNTLDVESRTYMGTLSKYSDKEAKPIALYSSDGGEIADIVYNEGGILSQAEYGFFVSYKKVVDENGAQGISMTLKTTGGNVEYFISADNTTQYQNAMKLKKGDCIYVEKNISGSVELFGGIFLKRTDSEPAAPVTGKVTTTAGISGGHTLENNWIYGKVEAVEDSYIKVVPAGKENTGFVFWCYAENMSALRIDAEGNVKNGLSASIVKPGDMVLMRYSYGPSWIAVYE